MERIPLFSFSSFSVFFFPLLSNLQNKLLVFFLSFFSHKKKEKKKYTYRHLSEILFTFFP